MFFVGDVSGVGRSVRLCGSLQVAVVCALGSQLSWDSPAPLVSILSSIAGLVCVFGVRG